MPTANTDASAAAGYAKGRRRREELIAAAAEVYADAGYHGASLREIAKRAGTSHAGLLYYFANREALLAAVLERRDEQDSERADLAPDEPAGLAGLRHLIDLAEHNQRHPGIVELYVRLAAEAIADGHPAREYFTTHYRVARDHVRDSFAALAEAGGLRAGVDPRIAAVGFIALMDGLQVQWLTNPDEVDLVSPLRFYLRQMLSDGPN